MLRSRPRRFGAAILASLLTAAGVVWTTSSPSAAIAGQPSAEMAVTVGGVPIRDASTVDDGTTVSVGVSGLLTPGTATRELRASLDPGMHYTAGTATAPEGWAIEYSTNGSTWTSTEPTPASQVTDVRATASVTAGAITGYSQLYSSDTVAPIPSSTFAGSTGGDGWDVFFYDDFVFNIFHHSWGSMTLDCHLRSSGGRCAGYTATFPGYGTANRSGGWVDAVTGKLYAFTQEDATGRPGVLCIDVNSSPVSCGFTALSSDTDVTNYGYLTNAEFVGRRIFGVETAGSSGSLLCYDSALRTACPGSPIALVDAYDSNATHPIALGNRIAVKTASKIYCFDAATLAACSGTWPASISDGSAIPPAPHTTAGGVVDGICLVTGCWNLSGAATAWTTPWSLGSSAWPPTYGYFSGALTQGRFYFVSDNEVAIDCFDYSTGARCANFPTAPDDSYGGIYAVRIDPQNPSCLWMNSDGGQIRVYDAFSGQLGCTGNPVITLQPSSFAPRFTCTSNNGIDEWRQLELVSVAGSGTASTIKLTVRDPLGNALAGWTDRAVSVGVPLDMTGLDVTLSGSRPTFSFAFGGVAGGNITNATIALDYAGKGPELCFDATLSAGASLCPVITGLDGALVDHVSTPADTFSVSRHLTIGTDPGQCPEQILPMTVPSAPRDLAASGSGSSRTLTFRPPLDDGGAALREYKLSLDGGNSWTTPTVVDNGDGTFSTSVSGLAPATTYPVELKATNLMGRSASATLSLVVPSLETTTTTTSTSTTSTTSTTTTTTEPPTTTSTTSTTVPPNTTSTTTSTSTTSTTTSTTLPATTTTVPAPPPAPELDLGTPGTPSDDAPVELAQSGLKPSTPVQVVLQPGNVVVGTATVGPDGELVITINLPDGLAPGAHHLEVHGTGADDQPVVTTRTFMVDWSGTIAGQLPTRGGYTPVTPTRVLDTRVDPGTKVAAGGVQRLVFPEGLVPAGATAVAFNLTVTEPERAGFLTVFACGARRPTASSLNYTAGETTANLVEAPVSSSGLCVYTMSAAHLVVDVVGTSSGDGSGLLTPNDPRRLVDTRETHKLAAGGVLVVPVTGTGGAPDGTIAAALDIAVTDPEAPGFLTVFPCGGARPWASTLNYVAGELTSNAALSALGADGTVCIYSQRATHVVVDLTATYSAGSGARFIGFVPGRLEDSRVSTKVVAGEVLELQVVGDGAAPAGTQAVVLNLGVDQPARAGFLTVWPCGTERPGTSALDHQAGETVSNHVTATPGADGKVCIGASASTHVVIDIVGIYWAPVPI